MSYTNKELIRRIVVAPTAAASVTRSKSVQLHGVDWEPLATSPLTPGSVEALTVEQSEPSHENKAFQSDKLSLSANSIAEDSLLVTDNSSVNVIYREGIDYTFKNATNEVTRLETGAIANGATVTLFYFPYTKFTEDVDFELDLEGARVRRISSENIANGQQLLMRFQNRTLGVDASLFDEAANEANRIVALRVDPNQDFGADLSLQTAATLIGASIICRASASALLATGATRRDADSWLELAHDYRNEATGILERFAPPRHNLSGPRNA